MMYDEQLRCEDPSDSHKVDLEKIPFREICLSNIFINFDQKNIDNIIYKNMTLKTKSFWPHWFCSRGA